MNLLMALYFIGEAIARLFRRKLRGALGSARFLLSTLFTISVLRAALAR